MKSMQMEDLLRGLREEGVKDSSGQFTMTLEQATPKLRKFLLRNPWHYSLKLVQAGVAAGASTIRIASTSREFRIDFEGAAWDAGELDKLFYYLLEARSTRHNRSLRHLATAMNSAVHLGADSIVMDNYTGERAWRHKWSTEGPEVRSLSPRGPKRSRFVLVRSLPETAGGWWNTLNRDLLPLAFGLRETMDREQAVIHDRCHWCTVPLSLNGRWVHRSRFGEPWRGHKSSADSHFLEWFVPLADDDDLVSGIRVGAQSRALKSLGALPGTSCRAMLGLPLAWSETSVMYAVEDGVLLAQDAPYLGYPGVVAVVCASQLPRDLGGFTVARDERYQRFLRQLGEWARELRDLFRKQQYPDAKIRELFPAKEP